MASEAFFFDDPCELCCYLRQLVQFLATIIRRKDYGKWALRYCAGVNECCGRKE